MSAPNLKEIEWAISELAQEESSFTGYARLADLYTVRRELLETSGPQAQAASYSETSGSSGASVGLYGDSEFLQAVAGKDPASVWRVLDELMDTLQVVKSRAYESVMRKLERI